MTSKRAATSLAERLAQVLSEWKGESIWFTERLAVAEATTFAQQRFVLRHSSHTEQHIHLSARWGHDLSLLIGALTTLRCDDRRVTVVEQLGEQVVRTTKLLRLALRDDAATNAGDARHVVFNEGVDLKCLGAEQIWCFSDNLAVGQSAIAADEHLRLRQLVPAKPGRHLSQRDFEEVTRGESTAPIVLWVGASLREQLGFWWACHVAASSNSPGAAPLWCASPANTAPRDTLSVLSPESLASFFCDATLLPRPAIDFFAAKWVAFCRGSVRTEVLRPWPKTKNWLLRPPIDFDAMVPRRRRGRFFLSALDHELLRPFSDWQTPMLVLENGPESWSRCFRVLGDSIPDRIDEWAAYESGRYLSARPTAHERPFMRHEYRLTDEGRAVLRSGVSSARRLPNLAWGGFGRPTRSS